MVRSGAPVEPASSTSVPASPSSAITWRQAPQGEAGGEAPDGDGHGANASGAGRDRRGDGVALGADREPVGGVLDVAADVRSARARRGPRRRR